MSPILSSHSELLDCVFSDFSILGEGQWGCEFQGVVNYHFLPEWGQYFEARYIFEAGCLLEHMVRVYHMGKLCSVQGVVILGLIIQNMISIPKFKNLPAKGYYVCKHKKFQNIVWANRVSHFKLICTSLSHLHPST